MSHRLLIWLLLLTINTASPVRAAFVLDDFDIPAQLVGEGSIVTEGVGELKANRHIGLGGSQADVIGSLDVDNTASSQLSANIAGLVPESVGFPIVSFNTAYLFTAPINFTEEARNDSFFIEMTTFQGPKPPDFVRIAVRNDSGVFFTLVPAALLPTDEPVTLVLPFATFVPRGGGTEIPDFTTIDLVEVLFRLSTGFADPNQRWFVQIDRIRVGKVIPEPEEWQFGLITALMLAAIADRRCCSR